MGRAVEPRSAGAWLAHNLAVGSVPAMASDLFLMGRGAWLALQGLTLLVTVLLALPVRRRRGGAR